MESREICITRRSKAFQGTDRQPHMPSPPENLDSSLQNIVLRPAIHQFIAVLLRLPSTVSPSTPRFHGPPYINAALFEPSTSASSNVIKRSSHKCHEGKEEYMNPISIETGQNISPYPTSPEAIYPTRWPPAGATMYSAL